MVNSIVIPVIIAYKIKNTNIYLPNGLVDTIFMLALTNAFVPPILLLFDPFNIWMKIKRCRNSTPSNFKLYLVSKLHQTQR